MPGERRISVQIASALGRKGAQDLLDMALEYYDTGVIDENGKFIHGPNMNDGCANVYIWPPDAEDT